MSKGLRLAVFVAAFLMTSMLGLPRSMEAATASLQATPATGVYSINNSFTVRVTVNSGGQPINAAEGELRFNPQELSVISINRTGSVFNLWVAEPTFSNSAGTINFSGGSPTGYTGSGGTVFSVTFRALRAGTSRLTFATGAVLANDGRGTNILSGMNGGTFTIEAVSSQPTPEVIEYVAPANTPAAPVVVSDTHPVGVWSAKKTAELSWTLPSDVIAVRTLLDDRPTTVPTKLYETPIRSLILNDLPEGESYFHIQFQNADGWGRVTHYRLAVDSEKPTSVTVSLPHEADLTNPIQRLRIEVDETTSPITRYLVRIDDGDVVTVEADKLESGLLVLPALTPGYHSVIIEAVDSAGNGQIGTFSFTLDAFSAPALTDFPFELNAGVIPVYRGTTRPHAKVTVTLTKLGTESRSYEVQADEAGTFVFIPEGPLTEGVYEVVARAIDQYGAQSLESESVRTAVQQPGFLRFGSLLVSVMSVIVPLIGMTALLILIVWWLIISARRFRQRVDFESTEAEEIVRREFTALRTAVDARSLRLAEQKRTKKLTDAEAKIFVEISSDLTEAESRILKEVKDVGRLIQ